MTMQDTTTIQTSTLNSINREDSQSGLSFETAFTRLEEILEKMNSGSVTLDESLRLFEEANHLITACSQQLNEAERKIATLIRGRGGDLVIGTDQKPLVQDFQLTPS